MRRPLIAGNWKMNKTIAEAVAFARALMPQVDSASHCDVVVAPPFTALRAVADALKRTNIAVSAQDMHWDKEGAHTGDISPSMVLDAGCAYVIIGHSERRRDHGESDAEVNRKLKAAVTSGLVPIVCLGETLEEREAARTEEVLEQQFRGGFHGLTPPQFSHIIVAYEPVWAIGTGRTATCQVAAQSHRHIRRMATEEFGEKATELKILYGGSVTPENIGGLMAEEEIDGALVGGASLKVDTFAAIVNYPQMVGAGRHRQEIR